MTFEKEIEKLKELGCHLECPFGCDAAGYLCNGNAQATACGRSLIVQDNGEELDISEMQNFIRTYWNDLEMGEKGMTPDEAEVFLGHSAKDMSQEEIDREVSDIQLSYYLIGPASELELAEMFMIMKQKKK